MTYSNINITLAHLSEDEYFSNKLIVARQRIYLLTSIFNHLFFLVIFREQKYNNNYKLMHNWISGQ